MTEQKRAAVEYTQEELETMTKAVLNGATIGDVCNVSQDMLESLYSLGYNLYTSGNYKAFTEDELTTLETITGALVHRDWFQVYDNFFNFTEQYNGQGLYWNYYFHKWSTFSTSPYMPAIAFTSAVNGVTSVTVSPATATVAPGKSLQLKADVVITGLASTSVVWSISGQASANTTISPTGLLVVDAAETGETITVTATSAVDGTKAGTATITLGA